MTKKPLKKPGEPFIPVQKGETVRQAITTLLEDQTMSALQISGIAGIEVKEVYEQLEHIKRTARKGGHMLVVTAARCRSCDFIFKKRERLKKPGKCPLCRSESITEPLFRIRK